MSEYRPRRMHDFPTVEENVASMLTALENLADQLTEMKDAIGLNNARISQLNLRERERNGNIEKLFTRMDAHDDHHGANDTNIVNRIAPLESDLKHREDAQLVLKGRKEVLIAQYKLVAAILGSIGIGGLLGAIGNFMGLWGF